MIPTNSNKPALEQAMDRLSREVRDGLRHGHFRLTIVGAIVKGKKRGIEIEAGKSYRFTIPEEEIK